MKKLILPLLVAAACTEPAVHPPAGGTLKAKDYTVSKNRAKNLNAAERLQIEAWIRNKGRKFYPMTQNYWSDLPSLQGRAKQPDGKLLSYSYEIYDFSGAKIYTEPRHKENVQLGKFEDLKAVEDALRYLKKGEEATLLVPSVLGFGTYGDGDKIPNDVPLIIKLKVL